MPEMDGQEPCARLKADLRTEDNPLIFPAVLDSPSDESKEQA